MNQEKMKSLLNQLQAQDLTVLEKQMIIDELSPKRIVEAQDLRKYRNAFEESIMLYAKEINYKFLLIDDWYCFVVGYDSRFHNKKDIKESITAFNQTNQEKIEEGKKGIISTNIFIGTKSSYDWSETAAFFDAQQFLQLNLT